MRVIKFKDFYFFFVFISILSKQVEHKRCPFFFQKVLVDLSISFLHNRHLKIGDIFLIFSRRETIMIKEKTTISNN